MKILALFCNMKQTILALPVLAGLLFFQCKEKTAIQTDSSTPPTAVKNKLLSGIYQGSETGSCLCIDAERGFAADSEYIGLVQGPFDSEYLPQMMPALKEQFREVKQQGAQQVSFNGKTYTLIDKAKDCHVQGLPIPKPVSYQDFCLKGKFPEPIKGDF